MRMSWVGAAVAIAGGGLAASADTVSIVADRDNTMFETPESIDRSSGSGIHLYSGLNSGEVNHRALMHFDVSGSVPAGATINSATLSLWANRTVSSSRLFSIHRVTAAWGEGLSDSGDPGGGGVAAEAGDASWNYRIYNTDLWDTPGGDFVATASASDTVDGRNEFAVFGPTSGMTADVQAWRDGSAPNNGWVLIGDESTLTTAFRFDSRESLTASQRPTLTIDFSPPAPCVGDLNNDGSVGLSDLAILLANFGGAGGPAQGDVNNDGQITLSDLAALLAVFGTNC